MQEIEKLTETLLENLNHLSFVHWIDLIEFYKY